MLIRSIFDPRIDEVLEAARRNFLEDGSARRVEVRGRDGEAKTISRPHPSPADWRGHWSYFVLLDRFNNPLQPPSEGWDEEIFARQGGTFEGVRQKLDYLVELGVGALWLSPFLKESKFCYGYAIQDFLSVDPRYGSEEELVGLVDEAHALGLFVIADAVTHHAGNVFAYRQGDSVHGVAPWSPERYRILWRNERGEPVWEQVPADCPPDAAVWPQELQDPGYFRRQGTLDPRDPVRGDFDWVKEFDPGHVRFFGDGGRSSWSIQEIMARIYQYWIARLDLDGLRLDSAKHLEPDYARGFCTAIREFASTLGKTNFLIVGEIRDGIETIASYVGRDARTPEELGIADSGILFPLALTLRNVVKEDGSCRALRDGHQRWARTLAERCCAPGDPVSRMVTAIDDHDTSCRFFDASEEGRNDVHLALTWLFAFPGMPCIYYGTEQGLHGRVTEEGLTRNWRSEGVREALWGKPRAFDRGHPFYRLLRVLATLRRRHPALIFGRTYWRPTCSGGQCFSFDEEDRGILAFSRINASEEVVVVANWGRQDAWRGSVLIDRGGSVEGESWDQLFSSRWDGGEGERPRARSTVHRMPDARVRSTVHCLPVELAAREILILGRLRP